MMLNTETNIYKAPPAPQEAPELIQEIPEGPPQTGDGEDVVQVSVLLTNGMVTISTMVSLAEKHPR